MSPCKRTQSRTRKRLTLNQRFFAPYPEPDFSLIVSRRDPRLTPNWPPYGWKSPWCPLNDSMDALRQWFDFVSGRRGVLASCRVWGLRGVSVVDDTWELIEHHRTVGTVRLSCNIETKYADASEAIKELTRVRDAIFPLSCPIQDQKPVAKIRQVSQARRGGDQSAKLESREQEDKRLKRLVGLTIKLFVLDRDEGQTDLDERVEAAGDSFFGVACIIRSIQLNP